MEGVCRMALIFDFTFAETAIRFLETDDTKYLHTLAETEAAAHIINHATHFGGWRGSTLTFITELLLSTEKESLPLVKRNLAFARENITRQIEEITLQYLPKDTRFDGKIFFTCGYDIGVAYGENCSLNLAHPKFLTDASELKYYAIHELHHVGFIKSKGGVMPSLSIETYKEMANLIAYLTHLEGMGTYAPLALRTQEDALNKDNDYIMLQNRVQLDELAAEYFEIYHHFKNNPHEKLKDKDWEKLGILSDGKRLFYIVGAHIARTIDEHFGRTQLLNLMPKPSTDFIECFVNRH